MNIVFKFSTVNKINLIFNKGATIDEILKTFLKRIDKSELINSKDKIVFLLNADELKFGDKTKIENLKVIGTPIIIVYNTKNLI